MSMRTVFLGLGVLLVAAGLVMSLALFSQPQQAMVDTAKPEEPTHASILMATRNIPMGTLLRPTDVSWKETPVANVRRGQFVQGRSAENEYMGAITRRELAVGEALNAEDVLKVNDQRFMAATLTRGSRAVSLPFETSQGGVGMSTASSLVLPGDHVDIVLTQNLDTAADLSRRLVAETISRDLRVIAVDRTFSIATEEEGKPNRGEGSAAPKTVTLEVSERQAQELFLASQLGKLHLTVRPVLEPSLAEAGEKPALSSTWAGDISPALRTLSPKLANPATGSVEGSVRYAPASGH